MEREDQERVKAAVQVILAKADMDKISERQVRKLASQITGLDLSLPAGKELVLSLIKVFLDSCVEEQKVEAEVPGENDSHVEEDQIEERTTIAKRASRSAIDEDEEPGPTKRANQPKRRKVEEKEEKEYEEDEEDEEDEEEESVNGKKKSSYAKDENGNITICELSAKRKVVVSQWKGKTLISLREFYEKDGKTLPTSKGISLTSEQFELLAKKTEDIEAAIASLQ